MDSVRQYRHGALPTFAFPSDTPITMDAIGAWLERCPADPMTHPSTLSTQNVWMRTLLRSDEMHRSSALSPSCVLSHSFD